MPLEAVKGPLANWPLLMISTITGMVTNFIVALRNHRLNVPHFSPIPEIACAVALYFRLRLSPATCAPLPAPGAGSPGATYATV
jgi:hypothetical protein